MMWRADAMGRSGRIEDALALIGQAKALIEQTGMENDASEILRVEGEIQLANGNASGAASAFEAALAIATRQEAVLYVTRARASLVSMAERRRPMRIP